MRHSNQAQRLAEPRTLPTNQAFASVCRGAKIPQTVISAYLRELSYVGRLLPLGPWKSINETAVTIMSHKWLRAIPVLLSALILVPAGTLSQGTQNKCVFLVAERDLPNPLFERSVILMLPRREGDLVVGLIVNKPTKVALQDVFPNNSALKKQTDTVYFGGPVDTGTPGVVFRSSKAMKEAFQLEGDLYVTFDKDLIQRILKKPKEILDVRLFLGRSQWAPGQLQDEMARGSWFTAHDDSSWIFKTDTGSVWPALIERVDPGSLAQQHARDTAHARSSGF